VLGARHRTYGVSHAAALPGGSVPQSPRWTVQHRGGQHRRTPASWSPRNALLRPLDSSSSGPHACVAARSGMDAGNPLTERRRSRTDRAWGCHTAQVLKSWA
jgi:hypothetical protein